MNNVAESIPMEQVLKDQFHKVGVLAWQLDVANERIATLESEKKKLTDELNVLKEKKKK